MEINLTTERKVDMPFIDVGKNKITYPTGYTAFSCVEITEVNTLSVATLVVNNLCGGDYGKMYGHVEKNNLRPGLMIVCLEKHICLFMKDFIDKKG